MTFYNEQTKEEMKKQMHLLRSSDADLQQEEEGTTPDLVNDSNSDTKVLINSKTGNSDAHDDPVGQQQRFPYQFIPLSMGGRGRTHVVSEGSRYLMENEVSLEDLQKVTDKFYELAFQDKTLDKFIRSHKDPHGSRFAKWIHQKLGGSNVWDLDRASRGRGCPVHDRTSAHVAAWYSPKRSPEDRGQHFQLDDCRVWMRLHFWALRESGLMEKSPSFADYYVRFIGHFVRVYESTAPPFARDALRWSANPKNIEQYLANGREMKDVLYKNYYQAALEIPEHEFEDPEWPYNFEQR